MKRPANQRILCRIYLLLSLLLVSTSLMASPYKLVFSSSEQTIFADQKDMIDMLRSPFKPCERNYNLDLYAYNECNE